VLRVALDLIIQKVADILDGVGEERENEHLPKCDTLHPLSLLPATRATLGAEPAVDRAAIFAGNAK
jgi:hypothetical protein